MAQDRGRLPAFLKRCFWDSPFQRLDPRESGAFVIERVLEYGDLRAVRWMQARFKAEAIRRVVKRARGLSARSANCWRLAYRIDRRAVRCVSKSFQQRRKRHWFA